MNLRGILQNTGLQRTALIVAVLVLVYIISTVSLSASPDLYVILSDGSAALAATVTALLCVLAWRRKNDLGARPFWGGMALGFGLWAVADILWGVYEVILGKEVPYPSIADFFFILAFLPFYATLISRLRSLRVTPTRRQKHWIGSISLFWLAFTAIFVIRPILTDMGSGTLLEGALNLSYPLGDLGMLLLVNTLMVLQQKGRFAASWLFIFTGLFLMTFSDLMFSYSTWTGLYSPDSGINAITILVDLTYTLAYITASFGIFLYGAIKNIKETTGLNLVIAPLARMYAIVLTNREHQVITASENFHLLVDEPAGKDYKQSLLPDLLGLPQERTALFFNRLSEKQVVSNEPWVIHTARGGRREVWVTGMADTDGEGKYCGANLALRANIEVPEADRMPRDRHLSGVLTYLLGQAGSLVKDETPSLRAYFIDVVQLLTSLMVQFGGDTFKQALHREINRSMPGGSPALIIDEESVRLPEECEGEDLANMLIPLMKAAGSYASSVVGKQMVENEIRELENKLDSGMIKDLSKYQMLYQKWNTGSWTAPEAVGSTG